MFKYVFFVFAAFISATQLAETRLLDVIFVACGIFAFLSNRYEPNIYSLLIILICIRALEILIWIVVGTHGNNAYIVFPTHVVLDSIALYAISVRNKVLAKWEFKLTGEITPHKYVFTNADYILSVIYKCYLLAAVLALGEHIIRHLDDFGLPSEWSVPDLLYIHSAYAPIKLTLNMLEYVAILSTAHRIMQSERYVHA